MSLNFSIAASFLEGGHEHIILSEFDQISGSRRYILGDCQECARGLKYVNRTLSQDSMIFKSRNFGLKICSGFMRPIKGHNSTEGGSDLRRSINFELIILSIHVR